MMQDNKIKPILFSTEMVRAILEGQKTVTRRVLKPQPLAEVTTLYRKEDTNIWRTHGADWWYEFRAPSIPGDTLWVRETWSRVETGEYLYKADSEKPLSYLGWRPSIHMPKEAARLFMRVTGVRVERLQDIDVEGCRAEGISDCYKTDSPVYLENLRKMAYPKVFAELWDSTIKPADRSIYGWEVNPWVWVIGFERCEEPEGWPR